MSHPVNDRIIDDIVDEVAAMSEKEKLKYLFDNNIDMAKERNDNVFYAITRHLFDKKMEQSV